MQEVELKIRLSDQDQKILQQWLEANTFFEGVQEQEDSYFQKPSEPFFSRESDGNYSAKTVLRLRKTGSEEILCYKQWHADGFGGVTHADEYEVALAHGAAAMIKILESLGYERVVIVKKNRHIYRYENIIITCDNVAKLGKFVELELAEQVEGVVAGKKILYRLLDDIGVTSYEEQKRGYSSLFLSKTT